MANTDNYAIIDASKTYTDISLAKLLGRQRRWVIEKLIYKGLEAFPVGQTYLISGHAFLLFVQENSIRLGKPDNEE